MADKLTPQQAQAVQDRGGKLLVSAAAGSGKTKVLIDRILSYLKDPVNPANIDDFLIITYTKAAAAELRSKIAAKLNAEIGENPGNRHLQRQLQRLYLAKISTVHSYCSDVLREHAYHLNIPVDFRVMEENESKEMQLQVIEKLLDEAYRELPADTDFAAFVDTQGFGRNDRQLPELVWKLYAKNARCHMDPDGWLEWCLKAVEVTDAQDVSETPWAKYLIEDLRWYLEMQIEALTCCAQDAEKAEGMEKPVALIYSTIEQMKALRGCNKWDAIVANGNVEFGTLRFPKKNIDEEMANRIKAVRDSCKKGLQKRLRRFTGSGQQIISDIRSTAAAVRGLVTFTRRFVVAYDELKRRKRVLDFGDLEHKMLDLLLGKGRHGPTLIAKEIGDRFREVMVDEYQDSNEVQDAIFTAITQKKQNCFMVGDVKQSIYQFRQADPEIFLEKYNKYALAEGAKPGEGRKVHLSSNFRSSAGVISAVNDVFSACMSKSVGGLTYGADEMLYEGIPHCSLNEPEVELYGITVNEAAYTDEASFVAQRIQQLLDGSHMVREGDALRPIRPEDIAILLRSPGSVGRYYMDALEQIGIHCCIGQASNLLETEEVQTIRAILQVVDNPQQDIPLLAALTSKVFGFTADDLAAFRSTNRTNSIYDSLQKDSAEKSCNFVSLLTSLRKKARVSSLLGLIKHIYALTRLDSIFAAMPDGEVRLENLLGFYKIAADFDMCGGKGLNKFLNHLEALDEMGVSIASEQSSPGAVTIMSIHKSKGLEFPVVFLPALSKKFNSEDAYDNMLCDKTLGIGLNCVDVVNRVRYPSISKHAISAKTLADGISEEMRVLYVAMTRARDRLIMTYTSKKLETELQELSLRMEYSSPVLLTSEADCPGRWILLAALKRLEAGAFFTLASKPSDAKISQLPWVIKVVEANENSAVEMLTEEVTESVLCSDVIKRLKQSLCFQYPHAPATLTPSKQTATQIKGRDKDLEAAEETVQKTFYAKDFRKPKFIEQCTSGMKRGTVLHTVMQYIAYAHCNNPQSVKNELQRLVEEGYLSLDEVKLVDPGKIAGFFATEIGQRLISSENVLREFKFSILEDAEKFDPNVIGEKILLQGVVDCALFEDDGITVIDFKTDRVSEGNVDEVAERYRKQVYAYADALKRIYNKPIKAVVLYFFDTEKFVSM